VVRGLCCRRVERGRFFRWDFGIGRSGVAGEKEAMTAKLVHTYVCRLCDKTARVHMASLPALRIFPVPEGWTLFITPFRADDRLICGDCMKNLGLSERNVHPMGLHRAYLYWRKVADELPPVGVHILMAGPSGYRGIESFLINGTYNPEFRPLSPWLTVADDSLLDHGWTPTHWAFAEEVVP
jgi:hypothetical protein